MRLGIVGGHARAAGAHVGIVINSIEQVGAATALGGDSKETSHIGN